MNLVTINELKKNPKYYNYLLQNSHLLKVLNRDGFKPFKKIIDNQYQLTTYDKVNKYVERINIINNIIESVK